MFHINVKGVDQLAHMRKLICIFVVSILESQKASNTKFDLNSL